MPEIFLTIFFISVLLFFLGSGIWVDEILIWIPQTSVAIGSTIFFICVFHQFILNIKKR